MKKTYIPAIITLTAGFVDCLVSIGKGMSNYEFVRQLIIVLVVFFIFGLFVRFLVDKGLNLLEDKIEEESEAENSESVENAESEFSSEDDSQEENLE